MKDQIKLFTFTGLMITAEITMAADGGSGAYQAGNMLGKAFVAILAILIIRKLFFKKGQ